MGIRRWRSNSITAVGSWRARGTVAMCDAVGEVLSFANSFVEQFADAQDARRLGE